ncbi:DNA repair protein RecO C-terminal domain-containing protein [Aminithiophilus ramosus]|uniref:DNA repair protein RecO n=1 Tax=Aminithiophilus ramosus TaxID=3029084 RepID=A0A9Q7EXS7_9BACT|nr:DNA repair protein RecO C-terminal domain-containing protein [Aminithiophilus ramosus]QTX31271.1 DNA repair protein RecO C-terminal domain-containing protein [Aminithiophilus ramosus]
MNGADYLRQGHFRASGVVLRRCDTAEGERLLYLGLKGHGPLWVVAPGAARGRGRFGGATEPLVWSVFTLYKASRNLYLKEAEVKSDLWGLRRRPEPLARALRWGKLIGDIFLPGHPDDALLGLFFWSLWELERGADGEVAEWRFLWRWLRDRGGAPDLERCGRCGRALDEAHWQGESLLCGDCGGGGTALPSLLLRALRAAVMLSRDSFVPWSQAVGHPVEWTPLNERLLSLLRESV